MGSDPAHVLLATGSVGYGVFAVDELAQSAAVTIDTSWSAWIAGSASRASAAGAFRARTRAMALQSLCVARACDLCC